MRRLPWAFPHSRRVVWLLDAVEIVSPGDKFDFYAAHDVDEVLVVDPDKRTVDWFALKDGEYKPIEPSGVIELGATELAQQIDWAKLPPELTHKMQLATTVTPIKNDGVGMTVRA